MAQMWRYEGETYPDTVDGRTALAREVLFNDDLSYEMERWVDKEFSAHDIMGMLWDSSSYKSIEDIQDTLIEWFAQDLADDLDFIEEYGTLVDDEEED